MRENRVGAGERRRIRRSGILTRGKVFSRKLAEIVGGLRYLKTCL